MRCVVLGAAPTSNCVRGRGRLTAAAAAGVTARSARQRKLEQPSACEAFDGSKGVALGLHPPPHKLWTMALGNHGGARMRGGGQLPTFLAFR